MSNFLPGRECILSYFEPCYNFVQDSFITLTAPTLFSMYVFLLILAYNWLAPLCQNLLFVALGIMLSVKVVWLQSVYSKNIWLTPSFIP